MRKNDLHRDRRGERELEQDKVRRQGESKLSHAGQKRVPPAAEREAPADGAVSLKVDGSRVRATFVAENPNADMSSISEYELKGDTLTYKRDLQGQSSNYRETCRWSETKKASPVAGRPR